MERTGQSIFGLSRSSDRVLVLRLLGAGVLIALYYALDWSGLREVVRGAVAVFLGLLGHRAVSVDNGGEFYLLVDGYRSFAITANCTYADLALVMAPFCWRLRTPLLLNLSRLAVISAAIMIVNIARVVMAIDLYQGGVSWSLAHLLPDIAIHSASIAAAVWLALRSDRALKPGTVEKSAEAVAA
ncbi:MAG: hypothetical protein HZB22_07150 [Deltaproteobacteria bacterium]|nr:hypothetical protein [Deltaproteobacteria bacterium]